MDLPDIKAAQLLRDLHNSLREAGYGSQDLERFLVRTVFCLFADDTGVFEQRGMFWEFVETRTRPDGTDLGPLLASLFQVLDTPENERRPALDEDIAQFPHVAQALCKEPLCIPSFTPAMRERLLDACRFDWSTVSPVIFGALFQAVMDHEERRAQGAHYTTERNILKVLGPLFLDDLRNEFTRLQARRDTRRRSEMAAFHRRLGG